MTEVGGEAVEVLGDTLGEELGDAVEAGGEIFDPLVCLARAFSRDCDPIVTSPREGGSGSPPDCSIRYVTTSSSLEVGILRTSARTSSIFSGVISSESCSFSTLSEYPLMLRW